MSSFTILVPHSAVALIETTANTLGLNSLDGIKDGSGQFLTVFDFQARQEDFTALVMELNSQGKSVQLLTYISDTGV